MPIQFLMCMHYDNLSSNSHMLFFCTRPFSCSLDRLDLLSLGLCFLFRRIYKHLSVSNDLIVMNERWSPGGGEKTAGVDPKWVQWYRHTPSFQSTMSWEHQPGVRISQLPSLLWSVAPPFLSTPWQLLLSPSCPGDFQDQLLPSPPLHGAWQPRSKSGEK